MLRRFVLLCVLLAVSLSASAQVTVRSSVSFSTPDPYTGYYPYQPSPPIANVTITSHHLCHASSNNQVVSSYGISGYFQHHLTDYWGNYFLNRIVDWAVLTVSSGASHTVQRTPGSYTATAITSYSGNPSGGETKQATVTYQVYPYG